MAGDYASRMETLVKKNNPGWKPGDAFDTSILDQMDDTLGGLVLKYRCRWSKRKLIFKVINLHSMD